MYFTKMQAYGNDYIYINMINKEMGNLKKLVKVLTNRHFGIGSDGLVLISSSLDADFKMRIFNPDGSEAEMCGNAIRSVGKYVYEKGLTSKEKIKIETLGGIKELELIISKGKVINIKANIGIPIIDSRSIPVKSLKKEFIQEEVKVLDRIFYLSSINLGNPHTVVFVDDVDNFDVLKYGKAIENLDIFPKRTNVTFVEVINEEFIKIREWERGTGETLACGTGSCSAVVIGNILKKLKRRVKVKQIGGIIDIEWDKNGDLYMLGPSKIVFEGYIDLEDI